MTGLSPTPEHQELLLFRGAVQAAMQHHGWTVRGLAKAAGYHVSSISRMLHHDPADYRLRDVMKHRVLVALGDPHNYDACGRCSGTGKLANR